MPVDCVENARDWRRRNIKPNLNPESIAPEISAARDSDQVETKPATDPTYMQFRTRREEADAQIAEMNVAKMRASMVMREDVDRAMFEIGREARDRLLASSRNIAAEVASIPTAEGCEAVIDREHRIVLAMLVSGLREKIGAPSHGQH